MKVLTILKTLLNSTTFNNTIKKKIESTNTSFLVLVNTTLSTSYIYLSEYSKVNAISQESPKPSEADPVIPLCKSDHYEGITCPAQL